MSVIELYNALKNELSVDAKGWWNSYGTFWVVVDAICAQNTKFENALKSRQNIINFGANSLEEIPGIPVSNLADLIRPSGFYNTKAKRLNALCKAICADFSDFDDFKNNVSSEWLISQKGLGLESVYSILCYGCERPFMVFDKYTATLLFELGYEFDDYEEARSYLEGVLGADCELSDELKCAHFHALIVEFAKAHLKGKVWDEHAKEFFKRLL